MDFIYNFINKNGTVINTVINILLLSVGVISIFVIWKIYKIQKRDQQDYLEFRVEQEARKRKLEIIPKFYSQSGVYFNNTFTLNLILMDNNIAYDVYYKYDEVNSPVVISSERTGIMVSKANSMNNLHSTNILFSFKPKDISINVISNPQKYEFYLFFTDIDGNKYKNRVTGKGIHAILERPKEIIE